MPSSKHSQTQSLVLLIDSLLQARRVRHTSKNLANQKFVLRLLGDNDVGDQFHQLAFRDRESVTPQTRPTQYGDRDDDDQHRGSQLLKGRPPVESRCQSNAYRDRCLLLFDVPGSQPLPCLNQA